MGDDESQKKIDIETCLKILETTKNPREYLEMIKLLAGKVGFGVQSMDIGGDKNLAKTVSTYLAQLKELAINSNGLEPVSRGVDVAMTSNILNSDGVALSYKDAMPSSVQAGKIVKTINTISGNSFVTATVIDSKSSVGISPCQIQTNFLAMSHRQNIK